MPLRLMGETPMLRKKAEVAISYHEGTPRPVEGSSPIRNPKSQIPNPKSQIRNPQSAIPNHYCPVKGLRF